MSRPTSKSVARDAISLMHDHKNGNTKATNPSVIDLIRTRGIFLDGTVQATTEGGLIVSRVRTFRISAVRIWKLVT